MAIVKGRLWETSPENGGFKCGIQLTWPHACFKLVIELVAEAFD